VVVAVPCLGVRGDLALGEVAHDLAQRLVLFGELDVHDLRSLPVTGDGGCRA